MKRLGSDCVYLDISHKSPDFLLNHFPTVKARCLELGIDISRDPIPVVPAAHYTCGGVMVDTNGCTDISNLYAIGETSFYSTTPFENLSLSGALQFAPFTDFRARRGYKLDDLIGKR